MEHTRHSSLRAYVPFFCLMLFSLLFLLNQSPFRHLILRQICPAAGISSGGGGAWKGGGWGFVEETGAARNCFLFRRETGVDGVGTRLSFAAKTSRVLLGPREPPHLLRVAGTTWAGLIRKVHMLRLVVFPKIGRPYRMLVLRPAVG